MKTYRYLDAEQTLVQILDDESGETISGLASALVPEGVEVEPYLVDLTVVWEKIKVERDLRKAGGVKIAVEGVDRWFHTDDPSRIQYSILDNKATRAALTDETVLHPLWKTMSGVKVPMTVGRLREILDAGIVLEATVFNVAEAHRAAMQESENPAEYDYSGNWPQTYADWAALQ